MKVPCFHSPLHLSLIFFTINKILPAFVQPFKIILVLWIPANYHCQCSCRTFSSVYNPCTHYISTTLLNNCILFYLTCTTFSLFLNLCSILLLYGPVKHSWNDPWNERSLGGHSILHAWPGMYQSIDEEINSNSYCDVLLIVLCDQENIFYICVSFTGLINWIAIQLS